MKKKLALLVLVVLIAMVSVTPALAKRGQPSTFTFGGTITDIDGNTITVETLNGKERTVQVTEDTGYFICTGTGRVLISFDDLSVGDWINIKGTVVDGVYVASQVTVKEV